MRVLRRLEIVRHLAPDNVEGLGPRSLVHFVHLLEHPVVTDALQHVLPVPPAPLVHEAGPDAHGEGAEPAGDGYADGGGDWEVGCATTRILALLARGGGCVCAVEAIARTGSCGGTGCGHCR